MAKKLEQLNEQLIEFIAQQKIFFVATAMPDGHINLSPKGMDTFRVAGPNRALWLNVTGSGNETAAHLQNNGRITVMFCAFEGKPLILRLYGTGKIYHDFDVEWPELLSLFPIYPGIRQIIDISIELVQTSCGMAVPLMDFQKERDELNRWAEKKGTDGIKTYWQEKNTVSLDGIPTGVLGS